MTRVAVPELGRVVVVRLYACQGLDPVAARHRRVHTRPHAYEDDAPEPHHLVGREGEAVEADRVSVERDPAPHGVQCGFRLLVDLLEHVVLVLALDRRQGVVRHRRRALGDRSAGERRVPGLRGGHGDGLTPGQVGDGPRVGQQRRQVARHEHLAVPVAHDDAARVALPERRQLVRLSPGDRDHRLGPANPPRGPDRRVLERQPLHYVGLDEVRDGTRCPSRTRRRGPGTPAPPATRRSSRRCRCGRRRSRPGSRCGDGRCRRSGLHESHTACGLCPCCRPAYGRTSPPPARSASPWTCGLAMRPDGSTTAIPALS